jgi:twitching motility protein PilT
MVLMDDFLFKLWREEKVTAEEALVKAQSPDELAKRIANAQRGVFDDESDVEDTARVG